MLYWLLVALTLASGVSIVAMMAFEVNDWVKEYQAGKAVRLAETQRSTGRRRAVTRQGRRRR